MKRTQFNVAGFNVVGTALIGGVIGLGGCGESEDPAAEIRGLQESPGGAPAPSGAPVVVASLAWDVPGAWESREPEGNVRKAQFAVGGDAAEVVFFHFGPGQGGDVESNLARWARSVLDENGEAVVPEIEVIESGAIRTVTAEYAGTYMAGPPMGEKTAMEGWVLLGAVVEGGAEGSVFIRMTGPEAAVQGEMDAWRGMLSSVRGAGL